MIDRVDDVEARWANAVEQTARALYGNPGDFRSETAKRNAKAAKRRRRGLPPLPTMRQEMLQAAETVMLRLVESRPDLASLRAELEEAYDLRQALQAIAEERTGIFDPSVGVRVETPTDRPQTASDDNDQEVTMKARKSGRDAAIEVLTKNGGPMRLRDLTTEAVKLVHPPMESKAPRQSIATAVYTLAKQGRTFEKVGGGMIGLRAEDAVEAVTEAPAPVEVIEKAPPKGSTIDADLARGTAEVRKAQPPKKATAATKAAAAKAAKAPAKA